MIGQRPPSASASTCAPISRSGSRMRRIGRLRSEASPSNTARDRMAADDAHHQPRAGSGVAEIERCRAARAASRGPARRRSSVLDQVVRSSRPAPAGLAGSQNVLALEQALDPRDARASAARTGTRDARSTCRRAAGRVRCSGPLRAARSARRECERRAGSCELAWDFGGAPIEPRAAGAAPNTLAGRCRPRRVKRIDMRADAD